MKILSLIFVIGFCLIVVAQSEIAAAAGSYFTEGSGEEYTQQEGLQTAGEGVFGTSSETSLATRIGEIIQILLAFVGVVFLAMVLISGITWLTAGEGQNVKKAQARLVNAAIGLIITIAAYVAISFILTNILSLTEAPAAPTTPAKEETKAK